MRGDHDGGKRMTRRSLATATAVACALTAIVAAGAVAGTVAKKPAAKIQFLSVQQNDQLWPSVLTALTKGYAKVAPGSSFTNQYTPQTSINQKIQLLAGQGALPFLYNTPAVDATAQMQKAGQVLNIQKEFKKLGVANEPVPAAAQTLKNIYGSVAALPLEFNIEGVWYN